MKKLGYAILLKKYLLVDMGVLLLLIVLPIYVNPGEVVTIVQRAILYSGFITPVINYFEIKKSLQLPFYDNLKVSPLTLYVRMLTIKIILSFSIAFYA